MFLPFTCALNADETRIFYKKYAIRKGFGIRTRLSKKKIDNQIRYFILVRLREGKYISSIPSERKSLPTQANECPDRITLTKKEDKWYTKTVNEEHPHNLSPTKSRLFRGKKN